MIYQGLASGQGRKQAAMCQVIFGHMICFFEIVLHFLPVPWGCDNAYWVKNCK